jgi:hypothetical protein
VGTPHKSSNCLSSQQLSLSLHSLFLAPNQASTCSSIKLKTALSIQILHPAIHSHSPDHTYKLCQLANSRKAENQEHCIKVGLSRLLAAFTAHYQKEVHIRLLIRKE